LPESQSLPCIFTAPSEVRLRLVEPLLHARIRRLLTLRRSAHQIHPDQPITQINRKRRVKLSADNARLRNRKFQPPATVAPKKYAHICRFIKFFRTTM
jgi:hypothetical protein